MIPRPTNPTHDNGADTGTVAEEVDILIVGSCCCLLSKTVAAVLKIRRCCASRITQQTPIAANAPEGPHQRGRSEAFTQRGAEPVGAKHACPATIVAQERPGGPTGRLPSEHDESI